MKRPLLAVTFASLTASLPAAIAQGATNSSPLESNIWAPTFGSQHAPLDAGPYSDHLLNTTGQVMTVLGASVYEDNGASTLQRMYTSDGVECLTTPVTGSLTYTVAPLNPCKVQPGQALFVGANLDGSTQQFKVNVTIVHPVADGTETAASNIPTSSSVSVNTGCENVGAGGNPTCSLTIASGVATTSFIAATFLSSGSPPTVTDNGVALTPYTGYPQGPFAGIGNDNGTTSYTSLYVVSNESAGTHQFVSSGAGQQYPIIAVINLKKIGSTAPAIDLAASPDVYPAVINNLVTCNQISPSTLNEFVLSYFQNSDTNSASTSQNLIEPTSYGYLGQAFFSYGTAPGTSAFAPAYATSTGSTGLCVTILVE